METDTIQVEVAYATPERQELLTIDVHRNATLNEAIQCSGILELFPDIDLNVNKVGIFGQTAGLNKALSEGDRVEIYRPLVNDPRIARQQRVHQSRMTK